MFALGKQHYFYYLVNLFLSPENFDRLIRKFVGVLVAKVF